MQCAAQAEYGQVIVTAEQPPTCAAYLLLSAEDYSQLRNPFGGEPDYGSVVWAFGAALVLWSVGIGVGMVVQIVRRASR